MFNFNDIIVEAVGSPLIVLLLIAWDLHEGCVHEKLQDSKGLRSIGNTP